MFECTRLIPTKQNFESSLILNYSKMYSLYEPKYPNDTQRNWLSNFEFLIPWSIFSPFSIFVYFDITDRNSECLNHNSNKLRNYFIIIFCILSIASHDNQNKCEDQSEHNENRKKWHQLN